MAKRLNDLGKGKLEAPKLRPEIIIIRPGNNYRDMKTPETRKHIEWLKESIKLEGVKNPIHVEFDAGKVYLSSGECRLTAAQELREEGWDGYIPCVVVRGDEAQVLADSMIDNGGLVPTMLEFGDAVQRLVKHGWEPEAIAPYIPVSIADTPEKALKFVKDALELIQAPLEVKKQVREGVDGVKVSPALALQATRRGRLTAAEDIASVAAVAKSKGQKVAKRPKGPGKAAKAQEQASSKQEQLVKLGDRMADLVLAAGEKASPASNGAAQAWNQLRGR